MAIVRWDPFKDFLSVHDRINRLFEDVWGEEKEGLPSLLRRRGWAPALDMYETDKEVVVKAELPGLKTKDVDISVDEDRLTIKGERKFEEEVKEENFYRLERRYGSFERVIPLPTGVKKDAIKAAYKNGILEIHLPKAEEVKPKRIKVKVEEEQ